jgi:hypothetical protein
MAEKKRFRIEDCFQKEHCSYLRIPIYTKNRNMQLNRSDIEFDISILDLE